MLSEQRSQSVGYVAKGECLREAVPRWIKPHLSVTSCASTRKILPAPIREDDKESLTAGNTPRGVLQRESDMAISRMLKSRHANRDAKSPPKDGASSPSGWDKKPSSAWLEKLTISIFHAILSDVLSSSSSVISSFGRYALTD